MSRLPMLCLLRFEKECGQRCAQVVNTARCKQFSDTEYWTYASPAMMKSISIKVLLLSFLSISMMAAFDKQKS